MSAGNFHGVVNGSVKPNGAAPPDGNGTGRLAGSRRGRRPPVAKRAAAKRFDIAIQPLPEMAGFLKTELAAQDAPMWPIHPAMWLQPELRLAVPAESGMRIERRHTVPAPDAISISMNFVNHPALPDKTARPALPRLERRLPSSDLAPLGWDPRVAAHTAGKEDRG